MRQVRDSQVQAGANSSARALPWLPIVIAGALFFTNPFASIEAQSASQAAQPAAARDLFVTVGKSLVVESPVNIQRVSVGDDNKAEALAVTPREVLVNGKAAGETSLIVWQQGGNRLLFDLHVRQSPSRLDSVRSQLQQELAGQDVSLNVEGTNVFVRGTVKDMMTADRAVAIASTLGKPVNLLHVRVPPVEEQILLKVRFANVDRSATLALGANLFSTGALNTVGGVTTQQFSPPRIDLQGQGGGQQTQVTFTDALNILLFRPDLNLGATIRALQARALLEILAEPNLLTINGKQASFLAGGEFPVPVVQSGVGGAGAVTIQWREFGIRITFLPTITPRGTIRLQVSPEVSSLDFANALIITGFTVPAISSRKVRTEIELENNQSFAIAGLLDNRVTENLSKIPGLGDIPLLGKLFQSRNRIKSNTELLVVVTPELVRPVPEGQPLPGLTYPQPFLKDAPTTMPRTPGVKVTGPVPVKPVNETVPFEQLQAAREAAAPPPAPQMQIVPIVIPQPGQVQQTTPVVPPQQPPSQGSTPPNQ